VTETLGWDYASGDPGDLFYPMNGTGELEQEGYGQLLPVAAADYAGADSLTVMPASSYNAANCREPGEVSRTLEEGLEYDESKSEFLEQYLEQAGLEVQGVPSGEFMEQESFWSYFTEALEDNSRAEIRDQSPLPDWMADKSVDSSVFLDAASRNFPVPEEAFQAAQGYRGFDLYLPLHSAEASLARDRGMDAKLGISSEEPFDEFTCSETGFPVFRSEQPVGLSGEEVTPYADRSDPEDQVLLSDSPQEVAEKLSEADEEGVRQVEEVARQLDDDIMAEVKQ
jgi:hypothetical protein